MIYRGKIENIIFEFIPSIGKTQGIIILCDGLPGVPKQKELMTALAARGFFVIFPRYRGTWESGGRFLRQSPAKDIEIIIKSLKKGYLTELYANQRFPLKTKKIDIIGSSFGGSVALALANSSAVYKIVALSPIVDFSNHDNKKEQDLIHLGKFINSAFGHAYRFDKNNWLKMVSGKLFNPTSIMPSKIRSTLVCFDRSDSVIDARKIIKFANSNNLKTIEIVGIGHLSFSKLHGGFLDQILAWLKKS